ncbi:transcription factor GTE9-like [Lotus japonicus]|uniref:transcription factor GTE9-like n=1 Tax=Lotus japonicus TaxID=34305 RepID=UPI0025866A35|nr:transcription factor GTE9-like [Lotus japonicus]XP_057450775.1 transcription factor GTE9-like [Lotus japonicus]
MLPLAMADKCKSKRVYSYALLFAINSATKAKTTTVVPTQETTAAVKGPARTVETIDPLKKKQCFVALQRLMEHRGGRAFRNGKGFAADCHLSSKPLMDFETVKHKLDKGLYASPDQFAGDLRILFCNAMVYYPPNHEIHRIADKLSDFFEFKWKSMENLWAAETEREKEREKAEQEKPKRKPLQTVVVARDRGGRKRKLSNEKEEREDARMRVQKMRRTVFLDENLNSFKELEKLCGYSLADFRISNALMEDIGLILKPEREPFQNRLFGLRRKKEREAARMKVQQMKRTVFLDDNLNSFQELEKLCGYSLADCRISNALMEDVGLVLKP